MEHHHEVCMQWKGEINRQDNCHVEPVICKVGEVGEDRQYDFVDCVQGSIVMVVA